MEMPFRFLSHEQFLALSQQEKLAYLDRAVLELDRMGGRRREPEQPPGETASAAQLLPR
jgi:hypothetical protein